MIELNAQDDKTFFLLNPKPNKDFIPIQLEISEDIGSQR